MDRMSIVPVVFHTVADASRSAALGTLVMLRTPVMSDTNPVAMEAKVRARAATIEPEGAGYSAQLYPARGGGDVRHTRGGIGGHVHGFVCVERGQMYS